MSSTTSTSPMIHFHITGFGKFCGVKENPSTAVVRILQEQLAQRYPTSPTTHGGEHGEHGGEKVMSSSSSLTPPSSLPHITFSTDILDVHIGAVKDYFHSQQTRHFGTIPPPSTSTSPSPTGTPVSPPASPPAATPTPTWHIYLHIGVHGGAHDILVEEYAYNNATFRCPDEAGNMPHHQPISTQHPFDSYMPTNIPVKAILKSIYTASAAAASTAATQGMEGDSNSNSNSDSNGTTTDTITGGLCHRDNPIYQQYRLVPSNDPGGFVCNYLYVSWCLVSIGLEIKNITVYNHLL